MYLVIVFILALQGHLSGERKIRSLLYEGGGVMIHFWGCCGTLSHIVSPAHVTFTLPIWMCASLHCLDIHYIPAT